MVGNYNKTLEVYKIFAGKAENMDFSEEAKEEMFKAETYGKGNCTNIDQVYLDYLTSGKKVNGYAVGKRWMDVTVAMWFEDLEKRGWFTLTNELYNDPIFPKWWIKKVFKKFLAEKNRFYMAMSLPFNDPFREEK